MDPVKGNNVFGRKTVIQPVPRLEFIHRLPNLLVHHHFDHFKSDLPSFQQQRAQRRVSVHFLQPQRFKQLDIGYQAVFDQQVADCPRIRREGLEDFPLMKQYGADVVPGLHDQFSGAGLHTDQQQNICKR